jgi:hypothetical protein
MLELFLLFAFLIHIYFSDKETNRIWKILIDQDYRLKDLEDKLKKLT